MEGEIYKGHTLDHELTNFIKVWFTVIISFSYCFFSVKIIPYGFPRLLSYTPIIALFLFLPLNLHSMHLGGITAFFVGWMANFKLLLLAFDSGPLSDRSLSLSRFIATGCFPIKIHHQVSSKSTKKGHKSIYNYGIKCLMVAIFVKIYEYNHMLHPKVISVIYCFHIYFALEIMLAMVAALARALLGVELEPQFNEPYLSTSLQDFWGRRWNIMVSRILRPTVYDPSLIVSSRLVGRRWASLISVFATFAVSSLMHELIFYYLGRTKPTWVLTWFFMLHAVSLMVEIGVKKLVTWRWPSVISTPLTVAYVMVTGLWWFMPELLAVKADIRMFDEYARLGAFVRGIFGGARDNMRIFNVSRVQL